MRICLISALIFLLSCASVPERHIASEEPITFGEVDANPSVVKLFPTHSGHPDLHHFFLELKNSKQKLIDVELKDIVLEEANRVQTTHIRRISLGRYEIEINKDNIDFKTLKFLVQKKLIKHQLVPLKKPVRKHSSVVILTNEDNHLTARLGLKDKNGASVDLQANPEIILEGLGEVSELKMIKSGVWEFVISYPEDNQVFYISVRANGVLVERLFRFQHVEK
ncbi:MAG: hypothetical protein H0V66_03315 [Bdellovibrionales bacterium]|nr:hypothetical protein [Bdellovibrionales bacterium]